MDTKQTFTDAVYTGREIEFHYDGQHYFESHHSDTDWYIYHEETKETQHFGSAEELLEQTVLGGQNINALWEQLVLDYIL